jgi:beta-phosphoglucomutase
MDGVLVDAMPFHYVAMKIAINEVADLDLNKRTFYLLEGMPVAEMALAIFELKGCVCGKNITQEDIQTSQKVAERKKEIFKEMNVTPKPFDGVRELIIKLSICSKAVVSGAAKEEVDTIIDEIFRKDRFDVIINGDQFEGKGKPDPAPFKVALQILNVKPSDALVVENSPLGVTAANSAHIPCIITLNTSPLTISDFQGLVSEEKIFKDTNSARKFLRDFCHSSADMKR